MGGGGRRRKVCEERGGGFVFKKRTTIDETKIFRTIFKQQDNLCVGFMAAFHKCPRCSLKASTQDNFLEKRQLKTSSRVLSFHYIIAILL